MKVAGGKHFVILTHLAFAYPVYNSPFVEGIAGGVHLDTVLLNQEAHAVKERRRWGRGVFAQQNVVGFGSRAAIETVFAARAVTAVRVQTVQKSICVKKQQILTPILAQAREALTVTKSPGSLFFCQTCLPAVACKKEEGRGWEKTRERLLINKFQLKYFLSQFCGLKPRAIYNSVL